VFDLPPLITTSINDLVRFDETSARAASPLLWPAPPSARTLVAAVGGNESSEFLRQSREIVQAWARAGLKTEYLVVPGTDHFTVVDELTKPTSALFAAIATLARQANAG
jgi:arylformamidase